MDVAKRIRDLRSNLNLTTNRLANMAGISQSYLREIELGNKNPTVEILGYICEALGISLRDFFSGEDQSVEPLLISAAGKLSASEQLKLAAFINEIKK